MKAKAGTKVRVIRDIEAHDGPYVDLLAGVGTEGTIENVRRDAAREYAAATLSNRNPVIWQYVVQFPNARVSLRIDDPRIELI